MIVIVVDPWHSSFCCQCTANFSRTWSLPCSWAPEWNWSKSQLHLTLLDVESSSLTPWHVVLSWQVQFVETDEDRQRTVVRCSQREGQLVTLVGYNVSTEAFFEGSPTLGTGHCGTQAGISDHCTVQTTTSVDHVIVNGGVKEGERWRRAIKDDKNVRILWPDPKHRKPDL